MTTNQESIVANIETSLGLSGLNYNEAIRRLALSYGVTETDTNSMLAQYLQIVTGSTEKNINGLLSYYSDLLYDGNVNSINNLVLPSSVTNLLAWYDASNLASITSSGGLVSQWNDLSKNGHHATQGTGYLQPTYDPTYNSNRGGIDFPSDGGYHLSANTLKLGNDVTVFVAFEEKTQIATGSVFKAFLCSQEAGMFDGVTDIDGYAFTLGRDGVDRYVQMTPVDGAPPINRTYSTNARDVNVVFEYKKEGAAFESLRDGEIMTSATGGQTVDTAYTGYDIGHSITALGRSYTGTIMEIIIYDRALTTAERTTVRGYLTNKWGIA